MTRSPDSLIPSVAGQPASEKRDDKAFNSRQEGEANFAGRNTSERRCSIVNPTSDHADSAGSYPGANLSLGGEACYGTERSEKESDSPGRWHAEKVHPVNRRDPVRSGGASSVR